MLLDLGAGMYIVRVPSKENLADDPSRERYALLAKHFKAHTSVTLTSDMSFTRLPFALSGDQEGGSHGRALHERSVMEVIDYHCPQGLAGTTSGKENRCH